MTHEDRIKACADELQNRFREPPFPVSSEVTTILARHFPQPPDSAIALAEKYGRQFNTATYEGDAELQAELAADVAALVQAERERILEMSGILKDSGYYEHMQKNSDKDHDSTRRIANIDEILYK